MYGRFKLAVFMLYFTALKRKKEIALHAHVGKKGKPFANREKTERRGDEGTMVSGRGK